MILPQTCHRSVPTANWAPVHPTIMTTPQAVSERLWPRRSNNPTRQEPDHDPVRPSPVLDADRLLRSGAGLGPRGPAGARGSTRVAHVSTHRSRREPNRIRIRRGRRPAYLLRRRRVGWPLEDGGRRHQLAAGLRRSGGALRRGARRLDFGSANGVGGHGRAPHPLERHARRRSLQVDGRRRALGAHGARSHRARVSNRDPSYRPGHRVHRGSGPRAWPPTRAGGLSDHGRGGDVGARPLRR